jgi:hypothetical protein
LSLGGKRMHTFYTRPRNIAAQFFHNCAAQTPW